MQAGERAAFLVCRPAGHHASQDLAGGYCYLNKCRHRRAGASECRRSAGGTSGHRLSPWQRHATHLLPPIRRILYLAALPPAGKYAFLIGYERELGEGAGKGYTLNLPMPRGTRYAGWRRAPQIALNRIRAYAPEVLVVSPGVDRFDGDPIRGGHPEKPRLPRCRQVPCRVGSAHLFRHGRRLCH